MSKVTNTTFTVAEPLASSQLSSRANHQKSISASIIMKNNYSSLPLSKRRKVIFLYHSLQSSGPSFQWACEHVFKPGKDYVTLLYASTDEAYQIVDAKRLWQIAKDEISVEVEHKKKLERVEQELEILRMSLVEMDIIAQKVIMAEGDSKSNITKLSQSINSELIVLSSNLISGLQKAVYGGLEEYLMKTSECSVLVVKPKPGTIARRDSGISSSLSSPTQRSLPLRSNGTQTEDDLNSSVSNGSTKFELGLTSPSEPVPLDIKNQDQSSALGLTSTSKLSEVSQNNELLLPKVGSGSDDDIRSEPQSTGDFNEVDGVMISRATLDAIQPVAEEENVTDSDNPILNFQKHLGNSIDTHTTMDDDDTFGYSLGPELPSIPKPTLVSTPPNEIDEKSKETELADITTNIEPVKTNPDPKQVVPLQNPDVVAVAEKDHYSSSDDSGPDLVDGPVRSNKKVLRRASKANAAATAFLARSNSVSSNSTSAKFKPPAPQPKVKSIIDKIPTLDEEKAANEKLKL